MSVPYVDSKGKSHNEGDIWIEGDKTWTLKNGLKRTVNKLDQFRKDQLVPLCCPKCNGTMKGTVNKQIWAINKTCLNCLVDFEHQIMNQGKWEEYQRAKITANAEAFCIDMEGALQDYLNDSVAQARVSEDGIVEKWKDVDPTRLQKLADTELNQLKGMIDDYKQSAPPSATEV